MIAVFSKTSRYYDLPLVEVLDARGRIRSSRSLRPTPDVPGRLRHTIEDGDRLDHLAHKYYGSSLDWWHIADANPEFLSPEALLGKGGIESIRIPLTWDGSSPPWSAMIHMLRKTRGVVSVRTGTPEEPVPSVETVEGPHVASLSPPSLATELDGSVVSGTLDGTLEAALDSEGITLSDDLRLARVGATTWRITDRPSGDIYTVRLFQDPDLLNVYASYIRHSWSVTVECFEVDLSSQELGALIEVHGFTTGVPTEVSRVGKEILIPPRRV